MIIIALLFAISAAEESAICPLSSASLTVFMSNSTSASLRADFLQLQSVRECPIHILQIQEVSALLECASDLIIDVLYNELLSRKLSDCAGDSVQVINGNSYELGLETKLFVREEAEMEGLLTLIQWMNITRICVFLSENYPKKMNFISTVSSIETAKFFITDDIDLEMLNLIIRKLVNPQGFTSFLFLVPTKTAELLFQAMNANALSGTRLNIVMSRESAGYRYDLNNTSPDFIVTGPLFLLDQGCEGVVTNADFVLCKLTQVLTRPPTLDDNPAFSIMNVVNGEAQVIGSICNKTVNMTSSIEYPTAVSNLTSALPVIKISMNNGLANPNSTNDYTSEPFDYIGSLFAITDINQDSSILPYHQLQLFNLSLGLFEFEYDWALQQMSFVTRNDLGVAMLAGEYSGVEMGVYSLFTDLSYAIPQVGAANTNPDLSSIHNYPLYTRVAMSDTFMSVLYGRMLKRYGWTNVDILYCDDPWSIALYQLLYNVTQQQGIQIRNKEEYRMLPSDIGTNYSNYLSVYQDIVSTKVRIIVMILYGYTLNYSIAALYDLGLRRGDVVFLAVEWMNSYLFDVSDDLLVKIRELCDGAIQFYPVAFIGDIGNRVNDYYIALGNQSYFYGCYFYDATLLVAYALESLIATGELYEDPSVLNKAMRAMRFTGCTGLVTIQEGTNDRSPMMYDILNLQINDTGYDIMTVGHYDPYGILLFNFTAPIRWPDHTSVVPTDTRVSSINCPFEAKEIVDYLPGLAVEYTSLTVLSLISISITVLIWRKWWNLTADPLLIRQEISFDDYILFATIGIEALQYIAMGPNLPSWAVVLAQISNSLSVNMDTMFSLKQGMFWVILDFTLGGVCLWLVFIVVVMFQIDLKYKFFCSRIGDLGEKALPILGNVCFLPIISILMDVFQCGQAADYGDGVGFQSTFLHEDCYQSCWTFPHIYYVVFSVIASLIYLPTAVFFRPAWQKMQPTVHISTAPGFLMIKTMFQIIIIVGNKTLKPINSLGHGCAFFAVTASFALFTLKWRPYGYGRPNLWHLISLGTVLWFTLLTLLNMLYDGLAAFIWILIFLVGIAALCIFGIIWQVRNIPAMLYRSKGIEVTDLFRFMFSRGTKYLYLFKKRNRGSSSELDGDSSRQLAHNSVNQAAIYPSFAVNDVSS